MIVLAAGRPDGSRGVQLCLAPFERNGAHGVPNADNRDDEVQVRTKTSRRSSAGSLDSDARSPKFTGPARKGIAMPAKVALAALIALAGSALAAEPYPDHPVTLIVPYAAGGSSDVLA